MTWTAFHRRGEVLRRVAETADQRVDGELPLYVEGVAETFADANDLLGALQLRWHTRLAGRIERELMTQPMDLEQAVVTAWHCTADEMPGVRAVLDQHRSHPLDESMARQVATAAAKEHVLLAVMAGRGGPDDAASVTVGERIAERARATYVASDRVATEPGLFDRLKAALAA
jgi:capsular polysaccharide biosynthesis protein